VERGLRYLPDWLLKATEKQVLSDRLKIEKGYLFTMPPTETGFVPVYVPVMFINRFVNAPRGVVHHLIPYYIRN
jgi:hypothetical protein